MNKVESCRKMSNQLKQLVRSCEDPFNPKWVALLNQLYDEIRNVDGSLLPKGFGKSFSEFSSGIVSFKKSVGPLSDKKVQELYSLIDPLDAVAFLGDLEGHLMGEKIHQEVIDRDIEGLESLDLLPNRVINDIQRIIGEADNVREHPTRKNIDLCSADVKKVVNEI